MRFSDKGHPSKRVTEDVCIVCMKWGCHSLKHKAHRKAMMIRFAKSFLSSEQVEEEQTNYETEEIDFPADAEPEESASFHVSTVRAMALIGVPITKSKFTIDGAVIDTGSSTLSTIGDFFVTAACVARARETSPKFDCIKKKSSAVSSSRFTLGCLEFSFVFGGTM